MNITKQQIDWVTERVTFWWDKLNSTWNADLPCPKVVLTYNLKVTAGKASARKNRIKLSIHFIQNEGEAFDTTIAHELAHIFADNYFGVRCGHGEKWKRVMVSIGLPPTRCHSYKSVVRRRKVIATHICTKCKTELLITKIIAQRMYQGRNRLCGKCNTVFSFAQLKFLPGVKVEYE